MYLEYLNDVVAPYLNKHGGGKSGEHRAAFWYDIATHQRTPKVYKWLADHKCDKFEIDAAFTWKYQMVDVSLAVPYTFCKKTNQRFKKVDKYNVLGEAQYKNKLYTKWCYWMLGQIESHQFREKSLNWIAPSKAVAITWCDAAWDEITLENLKKGYKKCYMDPADFDEDMAKYDGVQNCFEVKFDPK